MTNSAADWQRARRPEHKLERREAILDAASALLDEQGVEGTTLSEIARRAGLSKANLYRYFESRESILLALVMEESIAWTRVVQERLAPLAGSDDLSAVAEHFTGTVVERPRLCMLVSSLWSVLERNVGPDAIADFKRSFHELVLGPTHAVAAGLPSLREEDAAHFIQLFFLFVAGAWPAANPAPAVAEVLARDEFAGMAIDFEAVVHAHALTVLRGILAAPR